MVPLISRKNIHLVDQFTIDQGISSKELISRASDLFINWFLKKIKEFSIISIVCGNGNNGADGYLIAEKLVNRGFRVRVYSLKFIEKRSPDNSYFLNRILERTEIDHSYIDGEKDLAQFHDNELLIDAILGNGTDRPLEGLLKSLVLKINKSFTHIYSVDVPSGLLPVEQKTNHAVQSSYTLSFEFPKLSFFAPENEKFVGSWDYGSIGLNQEFIDNLKPEYYLIEKSDIRNIIRTRSRFAHKGTMGKSLIIISTQDMLGAAILMIKSCIKSGAGITYFFSIFAEDHRLCTVLPEAICLRNIKEMDSKDIQSIAVGPGLGKSQDAKNIIDHLLDNEDHKLILDADALNIIASKKWHGRIPQNTVITPHIKEFGRLFGFKETHHKRIQLQRDKSKELGIYIILKGRYTSISTPTGEVYYNSTGNPAMAKGGSGDVLTGMIAGFIAQEYSVLDSCLAAVYLHGLSADLYVIHNHEKTMSPLDLIKNLPGALNALKL